MEGLQVSDDFGTRGAHQLGGFAARIRALDSQHGQLGALGEGGVELSHLLLHPREVFVAGGGVDHHAVAEVGEVDDQIVDHPATLVEHAAVQRFAGRGQAGNVVGQQVLQIGLRLRAGDIHHGHVRDIEHATVFAHLMMLFHLRAVVQRHVPATEIDHLGAQRHVLLIQRGTLTHHNSPAGPVWPDSG